MVFLTRATQKFSSSFGREPIFVILMTLYDEDFLVVYSKFKEDAYLGHKNIDATRIACIKPVLNSLPMQQNSSLGLRMVLK
jgi:hypothetical protein